jgi:hypothetical protein
MIYRCCDERRRQAVADHPVLNGIDYLEVLDSEAPSGSPRQRTLLVRFVKTAPTLTKDNFELTGGERRTGVKILWAVRADAPGPGPSSTEMTFLTALPNNDRVIALRTDSTGDYSAYTLHLVASPTSLAPPADIDPLLARVLFSFKVECPSDFDCAPACPCPDEEEEGPAINYLAKDYRSFRRQMLDRMSQTIPQWQERSAADLGIALVEMLAYVGDHLSYAQDAVATEAYLGTARLRSSVRRHSRLVAYAMHDGANARAWVQVAVAGAPVAITPWDGDTPANVAFLTRLPGSAPVVPSLPSANDPAFERLLLQPVSIFEPMHAQTLFEDHNDIAFHDWGEGECCLPRGAVRATLLGNLVNLKVGDVLIFEERIGPLTGRSADADPAKRCAVRLVQVGAGLSDPLTIPPTAITEIRWAEEDALPFPLCLSSRTDESLGGDTVTGVSHALGNIVLADHGLTRSEVDLGAVPEPHLHLVAESGDDCCDPPVRKAVPPRFRPLLPDAPVTQAAPVAYPPASAAAAFRRDLHGAVAQVQAISASDSSGGVWSARRDLLASEANDRHFVVEIESDGTARLRFGDDRNGIRPDSGTRFIARYRIGNGPGGNVGADALCHAATAVGGIVGVRNPLPASGGLAPESAAAARIAAPQAFRAQKRAVTEADYAAMALLYPGVQRAEATFRWNGAYHTVFITVDRAGGQPVTPEFEAGLIAFLEPYRMAGYDLEIDAPRPVPIALELQICVKPGYFRSEVRKAVLEQLSESTLPDRRTGFFHPDNLSFGQHVWLSAIVARAQSVDGVESVTPSRFGRLGDPDPGPLLDGVIRIGRLEIAMLANDPNFPDRGAIKLAMGGGK